MELIQQVAAVFAVLGLLVAMMWWLRRRGFAVGSLASRRGARRLECVERVALGPQQTLHLIRLGDRALLVASSPSNCALLRDLAWQEIASRGEAAQ